VAVDATCWFCRAPVRALAGVLVDPCLTADRTGFVGLADVAETVKLLDPAVLAAHNVGALRYRPSPGLQGGYLANGCPACDALIGHMASRISSAITSPPGARSISSPSS
jgi:hypothetical protein